MQKLVITGFMAGVLIGIAIIGIGFGVADAARPNQQLVITLYDGSGVRVSGATCNVTVDGNLSTVYTEVSNNRGTLRYHIPASGQLADMLCLNPNTSITTQISNILLSGSRTVYIFVIN